MHKLKAFFGGLVTPSTSEFWLGWGGIAMKGICLVNGAACAGIDTVLGYTPFGDGKTLFGSILAYTIGRMISKAAKSTKGD